MRRISALTLFLVTTVSTVAVSGPAAAVEPWRVLIGLPAEADDVRPLDRFVVAWQRHDDATVEAALADDGWSPHLRHWARARLATERGNVDAALAAYDAARAAWPATLEEPDAVQAVFDRDRLYLALRAGDLDRAGAIRDAPLRAHDDAVWSALGAWSAWLDGHPASASAGFDAAWEAAGTLDRRHPVFFRRALAHLAAGDVDAAGRAWAASVDEIRRPERHRAAFVLWDGEDDLRTAIRRAPDRRVVLRWLVRSFRREEAETIARTAYELENDAEERAWLYVFVAEQLYRLRRHEALDSWLAAPRPGRLDDEQEAELAAYPLGVRRRSGHSVELAAGFDAVALRHPATRRATEALWESAWMWELSEETATAIARYDEIVRRDPDGRYASSALLRSLWLRLRSGDRDGVRATFDAGRDVLRDGLDQAAAWWMRGLVDSDDRTRWEAELREEHPFSPMWRELAPARRGVPRDDVEDLARALFRTQRAAMDAVADHLGIGSDTAPALRGVERMAELGLAVEAETRLAAWAASRQGDTAAVFEAVRLAWRWGIPEVQGRYGWIVERRLRDDGDEVARSAQVVAMPTPFAPDLLAEAGEAGVDPALVWALIRRESFYDADVISIAGAHGLMQLIEPTAEEMARQRGLPEPTPYDLLAPPINLELGIHYLSDLLARADEDRVRALASYNAGEGNGRRWQARRDPDRGEIAGILDISYSETRAYVYHVTRHWNRYRGLYAETLGELPAGR